MSGKSRGGGLATLAEQSASQREPARAGGYGIEAQGKDQGGKGGRARPRQAAKRDTFPWINGQIIEVSESGDLLRLLGTIELYLPQMNLVNISTAFHRLAKLATTEALQVYIPSVPVVEALLAAARAALARASASGTAPSSQALSNITWAMATLGLVDEPLLQAIAAPAVTQVPLFKPFELSTILWSFAKLGETVPTASHCAKPLFDVAAAFIPAKVEDFSFRCLVTTIWAFATARHDNPSLFRCVATQMVNMVHTANCPELANSAWAFSTAGVTHERLYQELAKKANLRLNEFKGQELANILWGFAANNFYHSAFFANALMTAQRLELQPPHLAKILWAATKTRPKQSATANMVLALLPACTRQIDQFAPADFAMTALAIAKVCASAAAAPRGVDSLRLAAEFFAAAMPQVLPRLAEYSGQDLANVAVSFLAARAPGAVVLLGAVGREVLDRIQTLETWVLFQLIRTFSADLSPLAPPSLLEGACQGVARALFAEAARRLDLLGLKERQALSRLCAGPLGLDKRMELSPEQMRNCCFALATSSPALQSGTSLDDLLEEEQGEGPVISIPVSATPGVRVTGLAAGPGPAGPLPQAVQPGSQPTHQHQKQHRPQKQRQSQHGSPQAPWGAEAWTAPPSTSSAVPSGPSRPKKDPSSKVVGAGRLTDLTFKCSVKNTFLHVDGAGEVEEEPLMPRPAPRPTQDVLGPPLQFLPKDIELSELQAFRADYMAFRSGQANGARGEISALSSDMPAWADGPKLIDSLLDYEQSRICAERQAHPRDEKWLLPAPRLADSDMVAAAC